MSNDPILDSFEHRTSVPQPVTEGLVEQYRWYLDITNTARPATVEDAHKVVDRMHLVGVITTNEAKELKELVEEGVKNPKPIVGV